MVKKKIKRKWTIHLLESTVDLLVINIDFDIDLLVQLLLFVKLTNSAVCTALELCSELLAIFVQPEMEVDVGNDQRLLFPKKDTALFPDHWLCMEIFACEIATNHE